MNEATTALGKLVQGEALTADEVTATLGWLGPHVEAGTRVASTRLVADALQRFAASDVAPDLAPDVLAAVWRGGAPEVVGMRPLGAVLPDGPERDLVAPKKGA